LKKIKVGDVIKLTDKERENIKAVVDDLESFQTAFAHASTMLKLAKNRLFNHLYNLHPEWNGFEIGFDRTGIVTILSEKK
jgi:hypothetical protein